MSPSASATNSTCQSLPAFWTGVGPRANEPLLVALQRGAVIEPIERLGQRADRLFLKKWEDAFEPLVFRSDGDRRAYRLGASVESLSGSRFSRMFCRIASMRSRAGRRGASGARSCVQGDHDSYRLSCDGNPSLRELRRIP